MKRGANADDDVLQGVGVYTGIGIDGDGGLDTDNDGTIDNAQFPTGYNAFYMMKDELSQIQYVEFLNTLTRTQQNNRTVSQAANDYAMTSAGALEYRNGIRVPSSPGIGVITFGMDLDGDGIFNESNDGAAISSNFMGWTDIAAYLDWAALRPATELEFVKAARGTASPVTGEYVWGTTSGVSLPYGGVTNGGEESEVSASSSNNVTSNQAIAGPTRVGMYARAASGKQNAGSGYYGVLDLSGNDWEIVVPLGTAEGRSYTGLHGDGSLSTSGYANVANWPSSAVATSIGKRGGAWIGVTFELEIANRNFSIRYKTVDDRDRYDGCRGVRTAP